MKFENCDKRISFYFINVDKKKIGPFHTRALITPNEDCTEYKNNNFKMSGFFLEISKIYVENI
ncbi:hypothetical protein HZS_7716 [Henneguya salminicola]|nr:hypothetical protein HZS_7716 [Henneguya salminicola]